MHDHPPSDEAPPTIAGSRTRSLSKASQLLIFLAIYLVGVLVVGTTFCGPVVVAAEIDEPTLLYPPSYWWFLGAVAFVYAAVYATVLRLNASFVSDKRGRGLLMFVAVPISVVGFEAALWFNTHLDRSAIEHSVKVVGSRTKGRVKRTFVTVASWRPGTPPLELEISQGGYDNLHPKPHRRPTPPASSPPPMFHVDIDPDPVLTPALSPDEIIVRTGAGRLGWEWLRGITIPAATPEVTLSEARSKLTPEERAVFDRALQERLDAVRVEAPQMPIAQPIPSVAPSGDRPDR